MFPTGVDKANVITWGERIKSFLHLVTGAIKRTGSTNFDRSLMIISIAPSLYHPRGPQEDGALLKPGM
jgi:hypothetical protein